LAADPVARVERDALVAALQCPGLVPPEFDQLEADAFTVPAFRAVHDAIRAAGGVGAVGADPARWLAHVQEEAAEAVRPVVTELAVAPLPVAAPGRQAAEVSAQDRTRDYVRGVVAHLLDVALTRRIGDLHARMARMDPVAQAADQQFILAELLELEETKRSLRPQE
jgi:DNA primase